MKLIFTRKWFSFSISLVRQETINKSETVFSAKFGNFCLAFFGRQKVHVYGIRTKTSNNKYSHMDLAEVYGVLLLK